MIGLKSSLETDLLLWRYGSTHKISTLLAKWQFSLFAHSCNYFQVIKPILSRCFTVMKKSDIKTFSDFMITVIKEQGKQYQQGRITGTELELNFIIKNIKKKISTFINYQ